MRWIRPAPAGQPTHFSELFFDIIFVFAVVKTVELLHGHYDPLAVFEAGLIFWLLWWEWSQFTWTLSGIDTNSEAVQFAILLVTGITFFMATSIPTAFETGGLTFAIAFSIARLIGLLLSVGVSRDSDAYDVVRGYSLASIPSIVLVLLGGLVPTPMRYVVWGLVVFTDIGSTLYAARHEYKWPISVEHFSERHGLFMIIVLGETLIINASGLAETVVNPRFLTLAVIAVTVTLALWWNYFAHIKAEMASQLARTDGMAQSEMARDAYSMAHFVIFFGLISYASALQTVIDHPFELVGFEIRMAFALGMFLFFGGIALGMFRMTKELLGTRVLVAAVGSLVIVLLPMEPRSIMLVILAQVFVIALSEERTGLFDER